MMNVIEPIALLWPLIGHVALIFALYAWLIVARSRAVQSGAVTYQAYEFGIGEGPESARISRNLSNQFELPMLLYAAVLLLLHLGIATPVDVAMCWLFLLGRIAHSAVQILSGDVKLRGRVFTVNFLAVVALWTHLAIWALGAT